MIKSTINIKGMHCKSCEILIEDELKKVLGVNSVSVSHKTGVANIYSKEEIDQNQISQAIKKAGYSIGEKENLPILSNNRSDYYDLGIAIFIALGLFLILRWFGILNWGNSFSKESASLPIVFLIGLTAGVSTCMALVGGLVLGASARFAEQHPNATSLEKFKPHLFFNFGRIVAYFIFGGLIGFAGSLFQLSPFVLGALTIIVGLVMLILGGQLIEIFPILKRISFTIPKEVSRVFGIKGSTDQEYSHKSSLLMGALTFFLPCGFTQAMQLYAIATGSIALGSLIMGVFALGTTPGLLGIGGLTSLITRFEKTPRTSDKRGGGDESKSIFAEGESVRRYHATERSEGAWSFINKGASKLFFKTAGVVVIFLALFNISNALNILGLKPATVPAKTVETELKNNVVGGVQEIRMTQDAYGYFPNNFKIKNGVPVRWIITSTDIYTCASSIYSQQLGIRKGLKLGENVFEFTPSKTGTIRFSCGMGMYTGQFTVTP